MMHPKIGGTSANLAVQLRQRNGPHHVNWSSQKHHGGTFPHEMAVTGVLFGHSARAGREQDTTEALTAVHLLTALWKRWLGRNCRTVQNCQTKASLLLSSAF